MSVARKQRPDVHTLRGVNIALNFAMTSVCRVCPQFTTSQRPGRQDHSLFLSHSDIKYNTYLLKDIILTETHCRTRL